MLKLFIVFILMMVFAFVMIATLCAMIVAGITDEQANIDYSDNDEEFVNQLCNNCKTGKESYDIDNRSEFCQYLRSWKDGKCEYYVPLENTSEYDLLKK